MDTMFGGFRTRADATYRLLQAPGTAFLVVAAPERDALREASYFVERLASEDMPLAGLVLNRVHGSGADRLTAERALAAAEALEDADAPDDPADAPSAGGENLDGGGIVDHPAGKAVAGGSEGSRDTRDSAARGRTEGGQDQDRAERLTAGLLRLHAERMQVVARERRTRDRFVSVHPEVPMVDVTALPGDVHDLDGLRAIGLRLGGDASAAA
jgi:anion-transporting  ArsA/GET3 family ATPase